jgi:hypothetical protein
MSGITIPGFEIDLGPRDSAVLFNQKCGCNGIERHFSQFAIECPEMCPFTQLDYIRGGGSPSEFIMGLNL